MSRFSKEYTVFNVAQCHGLPEECLTGEGTALNLDERNADAQDFKRVTGADFREGQGEPYYAAGRDFISMPIFEAFKDADCAGDIRCLRTSHKRDQRGDFVNRSVAVERRVGLLGHSPFASGGIQIRVDRTR
jgi:antirestriction protein ArdC